MQIPLIPLDKANHALYGALAGSLASAFMALVLAPRNWQACALVAFAALAVAGTLGVFTERRQGKLNAEAVARGEPEPHNVDSRDAAATMLGGFVVSVPWLAAAVSMYWMRGT
jgi:hypothetical protein